MTVGVSADGAVEIVVRDDVATVCSGTPSTMTGTGRIEGGTQLVIPAPEYTCDDGSEAETLSGPPLEELLRDWTLFLDPQANALVGRRRRPVALRPGAEEDHKEDPLRRRPEHVAAIDPRGGAAAQELADAGDPLHVAGRSGPGRTTCAAPSRRTRRSSPVSSRRSSAGRSTSGRPSRRPDGLDDGDFVYIRARRAGRTPCTRPTPRRRRCAPTIDELRYETVKITVAQPDRRGLSGSGW